MGVVIKLGGINGSGKTTLARAVMALASDVAPVEKDGKRVLAYHGDLPKPWWSKGVGNLYVLGSYETTCGGMDTIGDQETKSRLVQKYATPRGLLLFEGILTGSTYGEFGAFSETSKQKGHWLYAFMDTPYDHCVARVLDRRFKRAQEKGKDPAPFDPDRTMKGKYKHMGSTQRRAADAGHLVYFVNWLDSPEVAAKALLKKAEKLI